MNKEKSLKVTLADVAREACVSLATTSLALRNSTRIALETRERVVKASERVGYSTNQRGGDSRRINVFKGKPQAHNFGFALVGGDLTHPFYTIPFHATAREAARGGQHIFCYPLVEEDSEADTLMFLESSECSGFLLMGVVKDRHYELLQKTGRPILVLGDHQISKPVHQVTFNDFQAGRAAVRHLAALGHRRIAFISENIDFFHRQEWLRGYREEMKALGIPVTQGMVQTRMKTTPHLDVIKPLFEREMAPTAVVATSHGEGMDVVRYCRDVGLSVPADISVLILGMVRRDLHREPLTCIETSVEEEGRLGMKRLREMVVEPHETPYSLVLNPSLVDHGSCGPVRASSPKQHQKAFTLVELLVVLAIISILAALLLPALRRAKQTARQIICINDVRQLVVGLQLYVNDHNGVFPLCAAGSYDYWGWIAQLAPYENVETNAAYAYNVPSTSVFFCPIKTTGTWAAPNDYRWPYAMNRELRQRPGGPNTFSAADQVNISDIKDHGKTMAFTENGYYASVVINYTFLDYGLWGYPTLPVPSASGPAHGGKGLPFAYLDGHAEFWSRIPNYATYHFDTTNPGPEWPWAYKAFWGGNSPSFAPY